MNKKNKKLKINKLSIIDDKQYEYEKIKEGLPQLRVIFLCLTLLYGAFGYLDYLIITEHFLEFSIIRFAIVIPLFLLFIFLSYKKIIFKIAQYLIALCLVAGGAGISYMLIMYPNNFSYYGGFFMVIFSGYFLLKLNSDLAMIGNIIILFSYIIGYIIVNKTLNYDTLMIIAFFTGANIIGALGILQLESMGRQRFMQEKEIKIKNLQLEERVLTQHNELIQVKKAFESTSDAMAVFNPAGKLTNYNQAFSTIMDIIETSETELSQQLEDVLLSVLNDGISWNGERTITASNGEKKTILIQGDSVYENNKIIGAVIIFKDITERKIAEEEIKYIGSHDHLTGLYNRYWYDSEIQNLDTKDNLPLSIIMADLNGLKMINDTYGHITGDYFLQKVSEIMTLICRESDLLARWGGDEFVIILPKTSYEQATLIAYQIAEESSQASFQGVPVSMALGVACKKFAEEDITSIMKLAEDKMYKQKLTESRSAKSSILNALNKALQVRSHETEEHTENMQQIGHKLGMRIGLSSEELSRLGLVLRLHDIGKINIPPEILSKNGALTAEEWEIIKKHTEIGYRITKATDEFSHVSQEILSHHEKWDGSGYPQNLKAEDIPYLARITNVVDSYEVMLNGRPYKKPMSNEEIVNEFRKCSGSQFDPDIVELFLEVINEIDVS